MIYMCTQNVFNQASGQTRLAFLASSNFAVSSLRTLVASDNCELKSVAVGRAQVPGHELTDKSAITVKEQQLPSRGQGRSLHVDMVGPSWRHRSGMLPGHRELCLAVFFATKVCRGSMSVLEA